MFRPQLNLLGPRPPMSPNLSATETLYFFNAQTQRIPNHPVKNWKSAVLPNGKRERGSRLFGESKNRIAVPNVGKYSVGQTNASVRKKLTLIVTDLAKNTTHKIAFSDFQIISV
jgi:hypothetical protein